MSKVTKRYQVDLPTEMYEELERIADAHQTSAGEVLKRFVKLGLVACLPDHQVVIVDGAEETLVALWDEDEDAS